MDATPNQHRVFVAARLKPVEKEATIDLKIGGNRLFLVDDRRKFEFDAIFDENATQVEVFNGVAEKIVAGCLEGFNGTIFAYGLVGKEEGDKFRGKRARLNLVDLAGSEKLDDSMAVNNCQKETANINMSLLQLGMVVRLLAKPQNTFHIPYRDSKLTHLLKDSLGGNSRTAFVIQLDLTHKQATLKSAEFAENLRCVKNQVHVNEDLESKNNFRVQPCLQEMKDEIAALQAENTKLKNEVDSLSHQCDELRAKNFGLRTVALTPPTAMSQKNRRSTAIFNGCAGNVARPHAVVPPSRFDPSDDAEMAPVFPVGSSSTGGMTPRRKRMISPIFAKPPFANSAHGGAGPSASQYIDHNVIALMNSGGRRNDLQWLLTPDRINHRNTQMRLAVLDVPQTPPNAADGLLKQPISILRSDKRPRMPEEGTRRIKFDKNEPRVCSIPSNEENRQVNSSLNEFLFDASHEESFPWDARPSGRLFDLPLSPQEEMRPDSSENDMALDIDDSMPEAVVNKQNLYVPDEASESEPQRAPNVSKGAPTSTRKQAREMKADERLPPTSSSLRRSLRRAP
ncbi:Kinesin-like protein [Aphelenchoides fujianensis]|nr:Kinesin-like protein [Aphelenchoides fujianensis]